MEESQFSTGILPIGYHLTVLSSINKFCDHVNCANFTDENGKVLISISIDELIQLYNNRLYIDEDIYNEFDIKNKKQSKNCEFDNAETINILKTIDIELSEKILAFAEN
ncbi:hypothetical protein RhiirA4_452101 [Rhizophagus irregularis]|uniref:Uncharacterized protein n=1 Tax=Rhizophagus irregularis TaxID=588596 RepID=A0A2I1FXB4_9GLOM|nr:hypothetical protein RhiirA4_452101 [Rhizophagus irregularis]